MPVPLENINTPAKNTQVHPKGMWLNESKIF